MKEILFVSSSRLSQNLFKTVLSRFATRLNVHCLDSLDEIQGPGKKGKPVHLMVIDQNCFKNQDDSLRNLPLLLKQRPFAQAIRILISPRHAQNIRESSQKDFFHHCYVKPFLPSELTQIVWDHLKS